MTGEDDGFVLRYCVGLVVMKLGVQVEGFYARVEHELFQASRRLSGIVSGVGARADVDGPRASVENDSREALAQSGRAPAF